MFCSNCGNELAEGARFCSACGTRIAGEAPHPMHEHKKEGFMDKMSAQAQEKTVAPKSEAFGMDWEREEHQPKKTSGVSFDWSSVIDEGHKKPVVDVKSPWETGRDDTVGGEFADAFRGAVRRESLEENIFREAAVPEKEERSRTLNYIEMMQQEKAAAASAVKAPASVDDGEEFDYHETILPESERENTQGYADMKRDIIAELARPAEEKKEAPAAARSEFDEQLAYIRERRQTQAAALTPEPPQTFTVRPIADEEELAEKEAAEAMPVAGGNELDAELAAILGNGSGFMAEPAEETESVTMPMPELQAEPETMPEAEAEDLFATPAEFAAADDEEDEDGAEDEYLDYAPRRRTTRTQVFADNYLDDESEDEEDEEEAAFTFGGEDTAEEAETDAAFAPAEAAAPLAAEEDSVEEVESEIEALQRRLAELLGQKEEEPTAIPKKETLTVEDLVADAPAGDEGDGYDAFELGDEEPVMPEEEFVEEPSAAATEAEDVVFASPVEAESVDLSEYGITEAEPQAPVAAEPNELHTGEFEMETPNAISSLDDELASLGFDVYDQPEAVEEAGMLFTEASTDVGAEAIAEAADAAAETEAMAAGVGDAMSIDELEKDLFGADYEGEDLEATRKIEKFYTLYRKNEEFQKLLDEEYDKLQAGSADYTLMDGVLAEYEEEIPAEKEAEAAVQAEAAVEAAEAEEAKAEQIAAGVKAEAEKLERARAQAEAAEKASAEAVQAAAVAPAVSAAVQDAPVPVEEDEEESKGGVLTVIAVIVAVLLVLLLVVILILNFAPDSRIAQYISETIGRFTNFAALTDDTELLL